MENDQAIILSKYTTALIQNLNSISAKPKVDEYSRLSVSQTASFFAILYEKLRNVVEYRETHLIRRAAIERILRRKLLLNPQGKGEGENLIRELLWARYFSPDTLSQEDVLNVQSIIDKYISFKAHGKYAEFLMQLLSCEIEENLSPDEARRTSLETFFLFQVLKNKINIDGISPEQKDAYFYVALEKTFNKSDEAYLRYNLFKLLHETLTTVTPREIKEFEHVDKLINNAYSLRMRSFVKNHIPPFKILFEVLKKSGIHSEGIVTHKEKLWQQVSAICTEKYQQTTSKLRQLAVKAIIYIFLTKMIFAFILEYPVSLYFFHEVNYLALIINSIFPPFLMFLIVGFTQAPGPKNTTRIFERLVDIIDADKSFETRISFVLRKSKAKKPLLILGFTVFYSLTFFVTFFLLHEILSFLRFNIISQSVFVVFVSLVAFFSYRIRNIAKEYRIREGVSFFRPFTDIFTIPFLLLGKFLSNSISKLNFITTILDFFIEAPFKLIVEVVEEWVTFVRARKEEIM